MQKSRRMISLSEILLREIDELDHCFSGVRTNKDFHIPSLQEWVWIIFAPKTFVSILRLLREQYRIDKFLI